MAVVSAGLLTTHEAKYYLLTHRSPGLTQKQIAEQEGVNQATVSRVLRSACRKVEELKRLCVAANGDPQSVDDAIDGYLMRTEAAA